MAAESILSPDIGNRRAPAHPGFPRSYERYRTRSPAAAELACAPFFSSHQLSVGHDRDDFQALGRFADAGGATVGDHGDEIMRYAQPCRPASVTAAVDLVTAETSAIYSVADLARCVGVSRRALELGFRKALNVTAHAFPRQTRTAKVHRGLLAADREDGTTVTEVAVRWGFAHTGRCAARYRESYAMPPSTTLQHGKGIR